MERHKKSKFEATRETAKFFEALLAASSDGIVVTDAAQNIVIANDAFCTFFGLHSGDIFGTNLLIWLEQTDDSAPRRWAELCNQVYDKGASREGEFKKATKDGVMHLSVNASLLKKLTLKKEVSSLASGVI